MKKLFLLLITLTVATAASAATVSRQQARQQAAQFALKKGAQLGTEPSTVRGRRVQAADQPLYIFNTIGGQGFIVVSGDDRTDAILGYTTQGSYDDITVPPALQEWLDQMTGEIEALNLQPAEARTAANTPKAEPQQMAIHAAIEPLIITTWNQGNTDNVYNKFCPTINGEATCTGCVATAGAQIMYYYCHPKTETQAVPGYTLNNSNGANTSGDLPPIQFEWDKMKTSYDYNDPDVDAVNAVARLMVYCGYAAKMNYGTYSMGGSSGSAYSLAKGMADYFDYDPNTWEHVYRSDFSIAEWDELIYNELANGRPIIYSGNSVNGGHAFICDGYNSEGLYHFNWGWGGHYNGFFKLQASNPYRDELDSRGNFQSGYIFGNDCVIGIQPNTGISPIDPNADDEWEEPVIEGIVASASNATIEGTTITMRLSNGNPDAYGFAFAMGELSGEGVVMQDGIYDEMMYYQSSELSTGWGFSNIAFDVANYNLPEGTHRLVPVSQLSGEEEWKRCKPASLYFEVTVAGEQTTIVQHPVVDLHVDRFELVTGGTPGLSQAIAVSITNNGDNLDSELRLYIGTADDEGKYAAYQHIRIESGNTKNYRLSTGKLEAGTYWLRLKRGYDGEVIKEMEVEIKQELKATNFTLVGETNFSGTIHPLDVTIENHAGDYAVPLYLFASQSDNKGSYVYISGSAIPSGGTEDVRFYFKPNNGGTWYLSVATDQSGSNIIGTGSVDIMDAPTGTVTFERVNSTWTSLPNGQAEYVVTYKNTSETTYYRDIRVGLLRKPETGTSWSYYGTDTSDPILLEPGQEITLTFNYTELEEGVTYGIFPQYFPTYASTKYTNLYQWANTETYTYTAPADIEPDPDPIPGNLDGDDDLDADDVTVLVNYLLNGGSLPEGADADVDGNGATNIADITKLIELILSSKEP